jgi:plastocyanin
MLNSKNGENLVFSEKFTKVTKGDTVTFKATKPGHNAEFIPGARIDGRPQAGAIHPGKVAADKLVATSGQVAIQDGDLPEGGVFVGKAYTAAIISAALRDLAGLT